jgi:hypothetical protein
MNSLVFLLLMFWGAGSSTTPVKYLSHYKLDEYPTVETDIHMQGVWKLKEDTNSNNYFVVERDGASRFSITYMNRGGDNRGLEHAGAFFSEVNGVKFLNAPYRSFFAKPEFSGTVLLRVDEISEPRAWNMTVTLVTDPNLYKMSSSKELREYVEKHMNAEGFYGKQLHFKKKFEFNSFR